MRCVTGEGAAKKDVLFIIGDWNAKVGSQETPEVTGKSGLGSDLYEQGDYQNPGIIIDCNHAFLPRPRPINAPDEPSWVGAREEASPAACLCSPGPRPSPAKPQSPPETCWDAEARAGVLSLRGSHFA